MLAVALLEGVLVHAAEQGPAITPPAPESLPATYAVVIADRGIPSWFSGIQIRGLRRIERLAEANMVIYIHGGDPNLEWTMMDYDQTVPNRRYRDGSIWGRRTAGDPQFGSGRCRGSLDGTECVAVLRLAPANRRPNASRYGFGLGQTGVCRGVQKCRGNAFLAGGTRLEIRGGVLALIDDWQSLSDGEVFRCAFNYSSIRLMPFSDA